VLLRGDDGVLAVHLAEQDHDRAAGARRELGHVGERAEGDAGAIPHALPAAIDRRRRGAMVDLHEQQGDPVLIWQAASRTMNPNLPARAVEQALAEDEPRARAEYGPEFRSDVESFVSIEALRAVTVAGRAELAPQPRVRDRAYVDPSGGSSDSMTLAISHEAADGVAVLDLVREVKPPFSPEAVAEDFAAELRHYGISRVRGDAYAGEWPRERFAKAGIRYEVSELNRSELLLALLPAINSGRVELLDHPVLLRQLTRLERRTGRTGKDSVDHSPGGHDDVANAAAGALVQSAPSGGAALIEFYRQERAAEAAAAAATEAPEQVQAREAAEHREALRQWQRAHGRTRDVSRAEVAPGLVVRYRETRPWHD
jgi:hypothetical protein